MGTLLFNEWLINRYGGNSTKESIAIAVNQLLINTNQKKLPIKLSEIAKYIGIEPEPLYKDQIPHGQLILINNEFRISLQKKNQKPPNLYWHGYAKLRFAYAHEIIHCLFYDISVKPPQRIAPNAQNNEEEVICNYGAGLLMLPNSIVNNVINSFENKNIVSIAVNLSKIAQTSLHAVFIYLFNNNFFYGSVNKVYVLSQKSRGYRERGLVKARCIISNIYLEDGTKRNFLPGYKGVDSISQSWSLISFHQKLYGDNAIEYMKVQNELIQYQGNKYLLNGEHFKIEGSSYVWSDLSIKKI